jgi:hypothetical protein
VSDAATRKTKIKALTPFLVKTTGCSHSKELRPVWGELALLMKDVVGLKFAKVDATKYGKSSNFDAKVS